MLLLTTSEAIDHYLFCGEFCTTPSFCTTVIYGVAKVTQNAALGIATTRQLVLLVTSHGMG